MHAPQDVYVAREQQAIGISSCGVSRNCQIASSQTQSIVRQRRRENTPELPEQREELRRLLDEVQRKGADDHLDDVRIGGAGADATLRRGVPAQRAFGRGCL